MDDKRKFAPLYSEEDEAKLNSSIESALKESVKAAQRRVARLEAGGMRFSPDNSDELVEGEAESLNDLLCPIHANLDAIGKLKPFDNCVACIRVERDELRKRAEKAEAKCEKLLSDYKSAKDLIAKFAQVLLEVSEHGGSPTPEIKDMIRKFCGNVVFSSGGEK